MDGLDFKVGDKVVIYNGRHRRIGIVEKITPKGFIKVDGILFNKDGRERSRDLFVLHIRKATEEQITEFKHERFAKNVLEKLQALDKLSYEQATHISNSLGWETV